MKQPNAIPPTLKTISAMVGVSPTTVSRVLSGQTKRYRISEKTKQNVLQIAIEHNYSPNELARGLALKRTNTIGLIVADITNSFFTQLAKSVEVAARQSNFSIILCDSEENANLEIESLKLLLKRKVDGFIITPVGKEFEHFQKYILKDNLPIVLMDKYIPELDCSYVTSKNYEALQNAVNLLIRNGHRRIEFLTYLNGTSVNSERSKGFVDTLQLNNINIEESSIAGNAFDERSAYSETRIILSRSKKPTAIIVSGNHVCLGALRAISEAGLTVPEDISIIAIDDRNSYEYMRSPITAIAQQTKEMGRIAVQVLIEQINTVDQPIPLVQIKLPTSMILRKSIKKIA